MEQKSGLGWMAKFATLSPTFGDSMNCFIFRNEQQYGPYSFDDLHKFLDQGFFKASDKARTEEMQDWVTVEALLLQQANAALYHQAAAPVLVPVHVAPPAPVPAVIVHPSPAPAPAIVMSRPAPKKTAFSPLTWPFHEPSCFASMWIPLLWWIFVPLTPAPPLALIALLGGMLLNAGWFIDAVRRRGHRDPSPLPHSGSFLVMLKDGALFFVMIFFYFTIPLLVIGVLFQWSQDSLVADAIKWAGHWIYYWIFAGAQDPRPESMEAFVVAQEQAAVLSWLAPIVYLFLSIPLFVVATVRFAVTRKFVSYFKVISNLFLLVRHFGSFLVLSLLAVIWYGLLYGGAIAVAAVFLPLVGAVAAVLLLPATLWVAAYLAGNFGAHLCKSKFVAREAHT